MRGMRGIQPRMRPPPPSVEPWGGSPEEFKGASHLTPPRRPALWARAAAALPSPQTPASAAHQIKGCIHQVKGSSSPRMHPLTSSSHDVMTVHQVKGLIKSKDAPALGSPWTARCSPRLSSPADLAAPAAPRNVWRPHSQLPEAPRDPILGGKVNGHISPQLALGCSLLPQSHLAGGHRSACGAARHTASSLTTPGGALRSSSPGPKYHSAAVPQIIVDSLFPDPVSVRLKCITAPRSPRAVRCSPYNCLPLCRTGCGRRGTTGAAQHAASSLTIAGGLHCTCGAAQPQAWMR